jgi:hypothetical protein
MVSCITSLASFIRTFIWVDVREEEQFFTLDRPYLYKVTHIKIVF